MLLDGVFPLGVWRFTFVDEEWPLAAAAFALEYVGWHRKRDCSTGLGSRILAGWVSNSVTEGLGFCVRCGSRKVAKRASVFGASVWDSGHGVALRTRGFRGCKMPGRSQARDP